MEANAIIDQIRSEEEQLRQRKQDAARNLREKAGELYRQASELQGEANLLTNQADELEGKNAPKDLPKVANVAVSPKPRRPRKPKADATTKPKRGRKPAHDSSEAAVRREKRAKKPPAEPSGRPRGGAVEPTPAAVLKIVKAAGDEGINKAGICKAGEFDNSKLGVLLQGMVRDEKLSKEGRGAGCEYFIAGA